MKLTNKLNLPSPFVNAVTFHEQKYKKSVFGDISTTTLIKPPQIVELSRRHREYVEEDVSNRLFALQGQIMHEILENSAGKGALTENRVGAKVLDWTITGQYDLIENDILYDYKYTTVWSYMYGSKEWELQANVNKYLLYQNGTHITQLKNVLMFRDFTQSKAGQGKYPLAPVVTVDIPMWSFEKAQKYIEDRVLLFQGAKQSLDKDLPSCSDEDRWYNRKTGKYIRCERYCAASKFCTQYNKEV